MAEAIGFIGLGSMGLGMARNLKKAGFAVVATTRSAEKAKQLEQEGFEVAAGPAALANKAKLVMICVPDAPEVEAVIFGEGGLAATDWPGGLVIDTSTIAPSRSRDFAARLAARGAAYIDAPISGGRKGADEGTLTVMVGGAEADVARAQPFLDAVGANVHHAGPVGAGQTIKACNQLMIGVNMMGAFEAITLCRAQGVDPELMREILSTGSGRSAALAVHAGRYLAKDSVVGFRAALMRKDLGIVSSISAEEGCVTPASELAYEMMKALCNGGWAEADSTALGQLYDRLNGYERD